MGDRIIFSHSQGCHESGVAVLLPRSLQGICRASEIFCDTHGRLILVDLDYDKFLLKLVAVYAPTQRLSREQVEFYKLLRSKIDDMSQIDHKFLIICGDMNVQMSYRDTSSNRFRLSTAAGILNDIVQRHRLIDTWRYSYPELRRYTWRRLSPLQQSRIDYVFASEHIISNHSMTRVEIKAGIQSDHSLVNAEFKIFTGNKGPGLFRFRNDLLQDDDFVESVRSEIQKAINGQDIYDKVEDCGLKLEMALSKIRVLSIKRSKIIAAQTRAENFQAHRRLERYEAEISDNPCEEVIEGYQDAKRRVDQIENERGQRAMLYSGARWMEQGEKPTKYFFNLCAARNVKKQINALQSESGMIITGNKDILEYCRRHFEKLYSSSFTVDENERLSCDGFLGAVINPRLDEADRELCDAPLTSEECKKALDGMMNNKAPSISGFPKEFFHFFWTELETMVLNVIQQAKDRGKFFITQRRGVLTLIPKKGDQKLISNKRAICLLDIVYKITAKVMANRLMNVLHKLIATDQTGSIRGRYIGTNLRTVDDVIRYSEIEKSSGILMALDFQNAFNTVEHKFVYDVLRRFNFGESFIGWIRLLHNDAELAIINNGYTSGWFKTSRGLQQGCPVSALLFSLVVEILAIKLRAVSTIEGIKVAGREFRLTQYCDDTTLFVRDLTSASAAVNIIEDFGNISGLQLNMSKSQFMWIGKKRDSEEMICDHVPVKQLKILGVIFSAVRDCTDDNMRPIVSKIEGTLNQWSQRDLTLKGRITIAKSLVVSQLIYMMSAASIEKKYLDSIQSKIMKFLWRGRPPKVSKKTLQQGIEAGGLNAPNLLAIYKAIRASWMGRIVINREMTFSKVFQEKIKVNINDITRVNYDSAWISSKPLTLFYKEMLLWFREAVPVKTPIDGRDVRKQIIWHNKDIRIDRKTVVYRRLYEQGIKLVDDFTDNRGHLIRYESFLTRNQRVQIGPLRYMSLLSAIPLEWQRLLVGSTQLCTDEKNIYPSIEINGKEVPIQKVKSSFFNSMWIEGEIPRAQIKWEQEGITFGEDWKTIYSLPFLVTSATKLQSLQYRIVHRYFPTRRFLCIRGVVDDPFCNECGVLETSQHYFAECHEVWQFWCEVIGRINQKLKTCHRIYDSLSYIIFGRVKTTSVANHIALIAKQFIVNRRFREERVHFDDFLLFLRKYIEMEKIIAIKTSRLEVFRAKWTPFISQDLQIDL